MTRDVCTYDSWSFDEADCKGTRLTPRLNARIFVMPNSGFVYFIRSEAPAPPWIEQNAQLS